MAHESFSVSELNSLVKDVVSAGFPAALWVCAEVQNYDRNKGKAHVFFDLVEKDSGARDVKAKIGAVIWAGTRPRIEALLRKAENAFELKDDIEVRFYGRVDFYPPHGALRFVIEGIDPVYTLGKIAQDRQRLIAELSGAGVLEKNKALSLSPVPLKIGLITAHDSAAYNDFIDELRKSALAFEVFFVPAAMQGKNCAASVIAGLKALQRMAGLDAIVITRGGGSIAELSCFDSKEIALAVAASTYPVLTGIGHEINTSITDLAAHTFEKTPTAIAQFLVGRVSTFLDELEEKGAAVMDLALQRLEEDRRRLKEQAVLLHRLTLELLGARAKVRVRLTEKLCQQALRLPSVELRALGVLGSRLKQAAPQRLKNGHVRLGHIEKMVAMASPKNILRRGFSITRAASGMLVRKSSDVSEDEQLETEFIDGKLKSRVVS
ncbi:MAG: exodeoxyribonuclease VII large subunit [Candidatus Omnitrophica bacterium]|nr:exodeoxyribonuclease VII large subunit [Candidatus Omnitrophota bacterium]